MKHTEINKKSIAVIGLKGLPAFGGAATVGQNIINQLQHQFKFTVFSVKSHASEDFVMGDVVQLIFSNFPIKKLNILFYYIKACIYVLFSNKFDLIHLHHTDGAFILPLLRLKYKVVLTSHQQPQLLFKWSALVKIFFKINERIAIYFATVFTAVSKPLQQTYRSNYKRDIIYIPNGVDLGLSLKLKENGINNEPYLLFAAGRIIPSKGLHLFLKALVDLDYQGKVKVAGNIDHLPAYKKSIFKFNEMLDIEFIGLIKEKTDLLSLVKHADLFVFPSLTEAMSIMLFEAALMKTPIICSDIAANKAVFNKDEVTFFKSDNVEDLIHQLKEGFENRILLKEKTIKAYHKLEKDYTWDKIALQYADIYHEMLNK